MSKYTDQYQKPRSAAKGRINTPEEMRSIQRGRDAVIREWMNARQVGTKPQTFKEVPRGCKSAQA